MGNKITNLIIAVFLLTSPMAHSAKKSQQQTPPEASCSNLLYFALKPENVFDQLKTIRRNETPEHRALSNQIQYIGGGWNVNMEIVGKHDTRYTKTLYPTVGTDQGNTGSCFIEAALNVIKENAVAEKRVGADFKLSTGYIYFFDLLEKANKRLAKAIFAIDSNKTEDLFLRQIREKIAQVEDGGYKNYVPMIIEKYGAVPQSVMPDTAALKDSTLLLKDLNLQVYRVINEMIYKEKEMRNDLSLRKSQRVQELLKIRDNGIIGVLKILTTYLGTPKLDSFDALLDYSTNYVPTFHYEASEARGKVIAGKVKEEKNIDPYTFAREVLKFSADDYVIVGSYPSLKEGFYSVKGSSVGVPIRDESKYKWQFINVSSDRSLELTVKSIYSGHAVEFSANVSRGVDVNLGIMHPDIHINDGVFGLNENEKGREMTQVEESQLGYIQMEHAMTFIGVDARGAEKDPSTKTNFKKLLRYVVKLLVKNSWGDDYGGSMETEKNFGVQRGDFHAYIPFFKQNVYEVMIPRFLLSKKELAMLETKPTFLDRDDAVRMRAERQSPVKLSIKRPPRPKPKQ